MSTREGAAAGCNGGHCTLASELGLGLEPLAGKPEFASGKRQSIKSALLLGATSVIAYPASAQQAAEPVPLPPLNVEATAKKKASAKKGAAKKAPQTQQVSPAPQPPAVQAAQQQAEPLPGLAAPVPAGQYNAEYSTSPKTTGPLLNTPQTVTVVPTAIIEERKSTTLIETLKNTPGITIDAGENGFASGGLQFNIRGFNSIGNVFVDGTRDNGAYARDVFNVEQVEVFKGPAADNGRGSAGGYVNIVTKTPKLQDFTNVEIGIGFDEYDSEARRRAAFDVNESSGVVAARLNAFVQDGGVAGRDIAEANAWGAAPSLAFGLGTDTRAIFAYEHVERRDVPDSGVSINRPANQFGVGVKGAGPQVASRPVGSLPRDTFFGLRTDYDDVNADSFIARFEHDLSDSVTVSNQTRWARVDRQAEYHNGGNGASIPQGGPYFHDRVNETLTNQTNLAARFYTGQFRHTLSTGIEYSREEADAFRRHTDANLSATNSVTIDTVAGYLYDTVEIDRHWQIVGGLRVEHYNVEIGSKNAVTGQPIAGGFDGTEVSETTLGGKIGLVYKPVREGSLYASYGTSVLPPGAYLSNPDISRPGGTNDDSDGNSLPGFKPGADPVRMHNYEIGAKWDFFNGMLSTTAAVFHTVKENVAYGTADDFLYGEQVVQGIELGIAGNLTEQWKVFGGVTWLDSERRQSAALDHLLCTASPGDFEDGLAAANCNASHRADGDELAFTPKFFASLWTTYDVTKEFTIGGGIQYVGESWIGRTDDGNRVIKNGRYGKLPDYFLVNLYASYDVTENLELSLNVDNVFDELYLTSTNWNGNWGYLGPPRTYWLNASVKY